MRDMQGFSYTPQKRNSLSQKKKLIDQVLAKDLYSPFKETVATNLLPAFTPLRKQPEYLLSPSPIKKDLFSQLLGTETRHHSPIDCNYSTMRQEDNFFDDIEEESSEQRDSSEMEESESENEGNSSEGDDNGAKKRKRKSTVQIKLLKQQLDGQMNWTKEKIAKMAEVTGLSQSQVYKWCWDQKKKQNKGKDNYAQFGERKKAIRKDLSYRNYAPHRNIQREAEQLYLKEKAINCSKPMHCQAAKNSLTKPKNALQASELADTNKKVNKRLIF